jgi:hypothetical protein
VAIPFLVALGFATAAATLYVNRAFGTEAGYLIMTGAFLIIGAVGAAIAASRNNASALASDRPADASSSQSTSARADEQAGPDREMLMAALASIGPVAAPALVRLIIRNLPLVAAIAAAGFVLTRPQEEPRRGNLGLEPAE